MNKTVARELVRTTTWKRNMMDLAKSTVPIEFRHLLRQCKEGESIVISIEDVTIEFNRVYADWCTEEVGGDFLSVLRDALGMEL